MKFDASIVSLIVLAPAATALQQAQPLVSNHPALSSPLFRRSSSLPSSITTTLSNKNKRKTSLSAATCPFPAFSDKRNSNNNNQRSGRFSWFGRRNKNGGQGSSSSLSIATYPSPTMTTTTTLVPDLSIVEKKSSKKKRKSLDVRIHGAWYDLSAFRKSHPAGTHWLDYYEGRDATEVMDGFHSDKARNMFQRMPKSKPERIRELELLSPDDSDVQIAFRKLRDDLEEEGWWDRDVFYESRLIGIWCALVLGAAAAARFPQTIFGGIFGSAAAAVGWGRKISIFMLSLAMTNAGWLGHDYVHGVDKFCDKFRNFVAYGAGLAPIWWSDKHNKHHALTNEKGVDEDIATDPFLYQWAPSPENDSPVRKIQHWIFPIPFSMLFALWRVDTLRVAWDALKQKRPNAKNELKCLGIHYAFLLTLYPTGVWLPAVFLSGLMSALIVTPTHQSEEMFDEFQFDWVTAQFTSTRSAVMSNPFSEWLWGGMQYQLEHHLFPSMPRMNYPKLKERLTKFANDNKIPGGYRDTGEFEILYMNWLLYKKVAKADPVPGAISTKGRTDQQASIITSNSPAVAYGVSK